MATTEELNQATTALLKQVIDTGHARVRWERAKETGADNLFALAQTHRAAEKKGTELFEAAVAKAATLIKDGAIASTPGGTTA